MDKIAVLIPCYNEALTVAKVVTDWKIALPEAAVFFIPVLVTYLRTGLVPNFPTLIVCGFTVMAALLSFFAGLQLQNGVQKNKQDFELERLKVNWRYRKMLQEDRHE